jgi:hypothetical protein
MGYGKPPAGRRFQKSRVRQPTRQEPFGALGRRAQRAGLRHDRRKAAQDHQREAIVTQMVNKSPRPIWCATKMLIDMLKDVKQKAGTTAPPDPAKLTPGPADRRAVHRAIAPPDRDRGFGRRRSVPLTGRAGRSGADGSVMSRPDPYTRARRCGIG